MKQDQIKQQDGDLSLTAMDGDVLAELEFAGYCAYYLSQCYPGHPWPVECHQTPDGKIDVRIRHWALAKFGSYCYYIDPNDIISPTALHKHLMMGGGEILDRLGLARNKPWDGQVPDHIDDVDAKWNQEKKPQQLVLPNRLH
jgi:hypothetical protein